MIALVLTPPNSILLPAAERGDAPPSETLALVAERWPEIERLLADDRIAEALSALEALACDMRDATARDAPLFREALTLGRRVAYDDLTEVGRASGREAEAREALARCAAWDKELRSTLVALVGTKALEPRTKLWLAHAYLQEGADDDVRARAAALLESLLDAEPELDAAARMLLTEARPSMALDERIGLLVESVERQPHWVFNRQRLAHAYREAGRYADAVHQIDDALRNATGVHPEADLPLRRFEEAITGRGSPDAAERLRRDRETIERGPR